MLSPVKRKIVQTLLIALSIILFLGGFGVHGLVTGGAFAPLRGVHIVYRESQPLEFWTSEGIWFLFPLLFAYKLVGYFKRIPKWLADERADRQDPEQS